MSEEIESLVVSDFHDWRVKVPENEEYNKTLANRSQCRAYKAYIKTLGLKADIYKVEYSGRKSEGAFIRATEKVSS